MANPQPTDAHLRVAHSINEAVMMRDFTKRQRKVLDLILRLSWGCGKKTAFISRQRDFEVVGIGEGHIRQELNWLVTSKIITIDANEYSFNKDFDQWQVSRVKPFSPEKLGELIKINLNGTYQNGKFVKAELTKTGSFNLPKQEVSTYQNGKFVKAELTKTGSFNLPKQEVSTYQNRKFPTPNLGTPKEKGGGEVRGHPPIKENNKENSLTNEIWSRVLEELQKDMNKANFETYWNDTLGLGFTDNKFTIGVKSEQVAQHLTQSQKSLVARVLCNIVGRQVEPVFVKQGNDCIEGNPNGGDQ